MKIKNQSSDQKIIILVPCAMTASGIEHRLRATLGKDVLFQIIPNASEAFAAVFQHLNTTIVMDVSDASSQLSEEIKFIHWCRTLQPDIPIIAFTRNHKISILNYLSALGLRAIISQYETGAVFSSLFQKSMEKTGLYISPLVKTILHDHTAPELTSRETEVLDKLFLGKNVSQVAKDLGRDIRTISSHKRRAMEKLGLQCEKDLHTLGCDLLGK